MANKNNFRVINGGKSGPGKNSGQGSRQRKTVKQKLNQPGLPAGMVNGDNIKDPQMSIDVNNDELEVMLDTYKADSSNENLNKLVNMIRTARLLQPAMMNEKNQPMPLMVKTLDGKSFLPVFTSKQQIKLDPQPQVVLNVPYLGVNAMALHGNTEISGIVINSSTHNLVFQKKLIERIAEIEKQRAEAEAKAKERDKEIRENLPAGVIPADQAQDPQMTADIRNDELEALVKTYTEENTVEKLQNLIDELKKSRILMPAKLNDDKKPAPIVLTSQNGDKVLPIFTTKDKFTENFKPELILNLPYPAANKMAIDEKNALTGMVINPGNDNLTFRKELLEKIDKGEEITSLKTTIKVPITSASQMPTSPEDVLGTLKPDQLPPQKYAIYERLRFELQFLPTRFFEQGQNLIDELIEKKEECIDLLYEESYENKRMYPYLPEQFSVMPLGISDDLDIVRIDFQEDDMGNGCCYRAYLTHNKAIDKLRYFAIRRKKAKEEDLIEICEDATFIEHGKAPEQVVELTEIISMVKN